MVEFIKSNNRILCGVFACFIALMLIMSVMTPVAFAAEEVKIDPIDFSEFPFDELPAERTCYIITKTSNGYYYRGINASVTEVVARKGAIGSYTYAGSVSANSPQGAQCCRYEYVNGSWNLIENSSISYEWFAFNDPTDIVYCSIPVYIADGEEMTLVYPRPKDVGSVLATFTGLSGLYWSLASGFLAFCASEPLIVFGIGLTVLSIIIIFIVKRVRGI